MHFDEAALRSLRPYPELARLDQHLVQEAFDRYFVRHEVLRLDELEHAAGYKAGGAERFLHGIRLLALEPQGYVRPSLLGVIHASGEEALRIAGEVDALLRAATELYRPGVTTMPVQRVFDIASVPVARAETLLPLLEDAGFRPQPGGGHGNLHVSPAVLAPNGLAEVIARLAPKRRQAGSPDALDPAQLHLPGPFELRWTGIEVSRFRALRDVRLDFASNLTVLVGVNGAGKSTALDACAFVTRALLEGLAKAVDAERGIARLRSRGSEGPVRVHARFEVDLGAGREPGEYAFAVEDRFGNLVVEEESLRIGTGDATVTWLDRRRAVGNARHANGDVRRIYAPLNDLLLGSLERPRTDDILRGLGDDLSRALLIDRDPLFVRRDDRSAGHGASERPADRRSRWSASIDELLDAAIPDQATADRLAKVLVHLLPTVREVRRLPQTDAPAEFEVVEVGSSEPSGLDELSAGMRQMILLAAVQLHPSPPSLLLLEEPDAGIHVGAYPALRDLLRSIARRTTVVATTHSPLFVSLLDPTTEVVVLDRDEYGVQARSLDAARGSRKWLASFADPLESYVRLATERRG